MLMHADDMKAFHSPNNLKQFDIFKSDFLSLVKCCEENGSKYNKCLYFIRNAIKSSFYYVYDQMLAIVSSINILGLAFNQNAI